MSKRDTENDVKMNREMLKQWMERHGHSIDSLADMLGMTRHGVSMWVTGARKIPEPMGRMLNFFDNYPEQMKRF